LVELFEYMMIYGLTNPKCKKYVCIPRRFLVINVCNQGKTLCSPCTLAETCCSKTSQLVKNCCDGKLLPPSSKYCRQPVDSQRFRKHAPYRDMARMKIVMFYIFMKLILMDPCIANNLVEIPTRCSFVIEFIITKFFF
jgi:hypothetical protein